MELTRHFSKLTSKDVSLAGGKGASLGEMTKAGLPVPPGFVVLAGAFERFIEETDLDVEIEAVLKKVNHKDINSVDKISAEIRDMIARTPMPKDITADIAKNFKLLKSKFVAVRSSATAEDSKTASWAGELETYLNVTEKNVPQFVKKCWSSLFTPRAIFYAVEKGFYKNLLKSKKADKSANYRAAGIGVSVAVVVQKMVQSEISGIAFTVHPVTKDYNQMVLEAGFGLGEAIVSGQVTPDTYIVHKDDFSILDINVSEQKMAIVKVGTKNIHKTLKPSVGSKQKLAGKQIVELAKICKQIEKHYKHPQDIEWAFEKKKFYLTQSRPITTL